MKFIVDKKPRYMIDCPFYDDETDLCHAGGYEENPDCWDDSQEIFNEENCPYFISLWDILPVVRCLMKDGEENG